MEITGSSTKISLKKDGSKEEAVKVFDMETKELLIQILQNLKAIRLTLEIGTDIDIGCLDEYT